MSISTELSSDVAAAVLNHESQDDPAERRQMLAILAQVHDTLRDLTTEERKKRRRTVHRTPKTSTQASSRDN